MRQVSLIALAAALAAGPAHAQEREDRREGEARETVELGAVDVVEDDGRPAFCVETGVHVLDPAPVCG